MLRRYPAFLVFILAAAFIPVAASATDVSGTITTTTWTVANSPYRVTDTVTIPSGETLTIDPAVEVLFDADVQFIVEGTINAVGTEVDSIRFAKGTAAEWGGLRITGGTTNTLSYVRISDGHADGSNDDSRGGAIFVIGYDTFLDMDHSVISGNQAEGYGGGLCGWFNSKINVDHCTFRNNTTAGIMGYGGGISTVFCRATITNSEFFGNDGNQGGGGIKSESDTVEVRHCVFHDNTANSGGAIHMHGATPALMYVENCTMVGNSANSGGSVFSEMSATMYVTNCIMWEPPATGYSDASYYNNNATVHLKYNVIRNGVYGSFTDSTGNIALNPLFADSAAGDFSLLAGSPCIDAGDPSSQLDIDGSPADIGAYPALDPGIAGEGTDVSGAITTTTWTAENSPYRVTGDISIPAGNLLTIEPGVYVLFDADVPFVIEGIINAVGTETDYIRFRKGNVSEWGGMRIKSVANHTLHYVQISEGYADGSSTSSDDEGGALYCNADGANLDIRNCLFSFNRADGDGGAVSIQNADFILSDCIVKNNTAGVSGSGSGGGIATFLAKGTIEDCEFTSNTVSSNGGAMSFSADSIQVTGTLIADNQANTGAVYVAGAGTPVYLTNCTLAGNTSANTNEYTGIAVLSFESPTAEVHVKNSIIWNGGDNEFSNNGGLIDIQYSNTMNSLPTSVTDLGNNMSYDPLFTDSETGDYTLRSGSPCINAGDPTSPLDSDGSRADMGAFENTDAGTSGGTVVSGDVVTTIWTPANSPYRVTGLVTVLENNTLTILPGVDVLFDADVQILVEGAINAVGTETDSIRFIPGTATEWGGIRIEGNTTNTLSYVRISGAHGDTDRPYYQGYGNEDDGGAVYLSSGSVLNMDHCVVSDNTADGVGGGVLAYFTSTLNIDECVFRNNSAGEVGGNSGGALRLTGCRAVITDSEFYGNESASNGAVMSVQSDTVEVTRCIFSGNVSQTSGSIASLSGPAPAEFSFTQCNMVGNTGAYSTISSSFEADLHITNCILWNTVTSTSYDEEIDIRGNATYLNYNVLRTGASGTVTDSTGNTSADPLFTNEAAGDYTLLPGSPCIDAGDPSSPLDADGSRADIGLFAYSHPIVVELALPTVSGEGGEAIPVSITATCANVSAATLTFLADMSGIDSVTIASHALEDFTGAQAAVNMVDDTVFVVLAAADSSDINGSSLVDLLFWTNTLADGETAALTWVADQTSLDEKVADLTDGELEVTISYGDVSGDGNLTAEDATQILEFLVRLRSDISAARADVSGNGIVRAYDAALVIYRVVNTGYLFPAENGTPVLRQAASSPRTVAVSPNAEGWDITIDNALGVVSGDLVLSVPGEGSVTVEGGDLLAANRVDGEVHVSFVRDGSDNPLLFHVNAGDLPGTASIISAELNEGSIPVQMALPLEFALESNAPNPFNPTTSIAFSLPETGRATLNIYNISGQLVRTLVDGQVEAGRHNVTWNGCDALGHEAAAGVYIYRLTSPSGVMTRRMVLAR